MSYWLITYTFVGVEARLGDLPGPMTADYPRNAVIDRDPGEWLADQGVTAPCTRAHAPDEAQSVERVLLFAHPISIQTYDRLSALMERR